MKTQVFGAIQEQETIVLSYPIESARSATSNAKEDERALDTQTGNGAYREQESEKKYLS
jgi:hypothetical protein